MQSQPELSAIESEIWQEFILQRCGLYFTENRLGFLRRRLWERMRARQVWSYSDYYRYVAFNPAGEEEWLELLNLLLNHETGFLRHPPSFDALTGYALPRLMQEKERRGVDVITMWSAGCSMGQEAYSLAMAFLETAALLPSNGGERKAWQVKITGSDLSQLALDKARRGQYKPHEMRYLSDHYRERYMTLAKGGREGQSVYRVADPVRALVRFGFLNLRDPDSYRVSAQDVIFCQNVLIYFKPDSRLDIVRRLCQRLNRGGYLFLAPAEVVGLKLPGIRPVRLKDVLIYQRSL